jgi:hypothetical protein
MDGKRPAEEDTASEEKKAKTEKEKWYVCVEQQFFVSDPEFEDGSFQHSFKIWVPKEEVEGPMAPICVTFVGGQEDREEEQAKALKMVDGMKTLTPEQKKCVAYLTDGYDIRIVQEAGIKAFAQKMQFQAEKAAKYEQAWQKIRRISDKEERAKKIESQMEIVRGDCEHRLRTMERQEFRELCNSEDSVLGSYCMLPRGAKLADPEDTPQVFFYFSHVVVN